MAKAPDRAERNRRALNLTLPIGSIGRSTARGGLIAMGAQGVRIALQVAGTAILARLLAPGDFGLLAMAASIVGFLALFAEMGLTIATIQRRDLDQETISTLFLISLGSGLALMLIAFAVAPLAAWAYGEPRVAPLIVGLALTLPFVASSAQHNAIMARAMRWFPLQCAGLVSQVAALAIAIALIVYADAGYFALLAQSVSAALILSAVSWSLSGWQPSLVWDWPKARAAVSSGLYLSGFNFLNYFHRQGDNVLVGWRYGSADLGYYTRAYALLDLPLALVGASMSQAAVPALARIADDADAWKRLFLRLLPVSAGAGIGLCAILYATSQPLVALLLGKGWESVTDIFRYLAIASAFASASNACGWAFISLGKSRALFNWSLAATPLFLLSFLLGLPWGPVGVAIGYSIAMAVLAPAYLAFAAHHARFGLGQAAMRLVPFLAIGGAMALAGQQLVAIAGPLGIFGSAVLGAAATGAAYCFAVAACLWLLPIYADLRADLTALARRPSLSGTTQGRLLR